jgi:hypothetical protein
MFILGLWNILSNGESGALQYILSAFGWVVLPSALTRTMLLCFGQCALAPTVHAVTTIADMRYCGFHFDPRLTPRADFWLTMAAISLEKGGGGGTPFSAPQTPPKKAKGGIAREAGTRRKLATENKKFLAQWSGPEPGSV